MLHTEAVIVEVFVSTELKGTIGKKIWRVVESSLVRCCNQGRGASSNAADGHAEKCDLKLHDAESRYTGRCQSRGNRPRVQEAAREKTRTPSCRKVSVSLTFAFTHVGRSRHGQTQLSVNTPPLFRRVRSSRAETGGLPPDWDGV